MRENGGCAGLVGALEPYDVSALYTAKGSTLNEAMKALVASLPADVDAGLINRYLGIC